jgi:His/Glu/Gln/Arg/opine family amino acid ABC transporter permease subunit
MSDNDNNNPPRDDAPQQRRDDAPVIINYDAPATKKPPLLEVGALAWIRKNLFNTPLDIFLTLLGLLLAISFLSSFLTWAIQEANWFAITFNFRRFMVDRFPVEQEGRLIFLMLFIAAAVGTTLAAYARRISPFTIGVSLAVLLPIFLLPLIVRPFVPLPDAYMVASNVPIVSGTQEEDPIEQLAFIGAGGEQITFELADAAESDVALSQLTGFMDDGSNVLRNAAGNQLERAQTAERIQAILRLDAAVSDVADESSTSDTVIPSGITRTLTRNERERLQAELEAVTYTPPEADAERIAQIQQSLAADADAALTDDERAALQAELEQLQQPTPIKHVYDLNQQTVTLQILDRDLQPIAEAQTLAAGASVSFTLPQDGWYVLDKRAADPETDTVTLLAVNGIYPIFAGSQQFSRATDGFSVTGAIPEVQVDGEGEALPYNAVIDSQFRGKRSLGVYLRIYLAPFFSLLTPGLLQLLAAGLVAHVAARIIDSRYAPRENPRKYAKRVANWLLITTPLMMFVMINGIGISPLEVTDQRRWGGLLLAAVITVWGIIIAFPLGVGLALGRRSNLPAVSYLCTLIIEMVRGTPFIVVLFAGQLLIPLINPDFASIPNVYRALAATIIFIAAYLAENVRGGLQSVPPGQEEAGRAVGLAGWQVTLFIMLPQALRAVIPALVGQFISLFKDTSLLAIVGLIDLTGVVNTMVVQPEFVGTRREGLLFISIIYFALSYIMSYVSRRIEESGAGSARRI